MKGKSFKRKQILIKFSNTSLVQKKYVFKHHIGQGGETYSTVARGKLYLDFNRLSHEKCINKKFNKAVCLLKNSRKTVENVISTELSFISVYEVICLLIKKIFY